MKYAAIVIGVSFGGMSALKQLLPELPVDFLLPVIIVQHISPHSGGEWINILNDISSLNIKEAEEKEKIEPGNIYIAPPNYHLLVERDGTLSLTADQKVNYARPSIDVLFETAAVAYKEKLIGIVLTGANNDGAAGLKKIKENGGLAIVQNPLTAESPYMPSAAIAATAVDYILSLKEIKNILIKIDISLKS